MDDGGAQAARPTHPPTHPPIPRLQADVLRQPAGVIRLRVLAAVYAPKKVLELGHFEIEGALSGKSEF